MIAFVYVDLILYHLTPIATNIVYTSDTFIYGTELCCKSDVSTKHETKIEMEVIVKYNYYHMY